MNHWLLPFVVSAGVALGAIVGMALASDAAVQEGPAGDLAGAFGALMVTMCLLVGFVVSGVVSIAHVLLKRQAPRRLLVRFAISAAGGMAIGAMGSTAVLRGSPLLWLLLITVPVVASWTWPRIAMHP